jgi:predicted AAA+ superfamily ATPase
MPKGILRDSGFCHFLQHITTREQLLAGPLAGQTFEAFVSEELIKGLNATMTTRWEYAYYRTRNGAEVDLVLEGNFGILPVEIKFGISTDQRRLTSLKQFLRDNDLPLGLVINNSDTVAMLAEKIIQIPAGLL